MKRLLLSKLLKWKEKSQRKPLLIDGARQTGKTYLLNDLLGTHFDNVLRLDFLESPELANAFTDSLTPQDILDNIELITGKSLNPDTDLLILDEIGECQRAVTSLKYFAEKAPHMYVAASGSNIGLLDSFPVGKVEQHKLRPLSFREFLVASNEKALLRAYNNKASNTAVHVKLMDKLTDYYFVGGMPEAVNTWFAGNTSSTKKRIDAVNEIHQNLVDGYIRDFGKYSGKVNAQLIEAVFRSVPSQLSGVLDQSVKRFHFKDVYPKKSRYSDFESPITWLHKCRLVLKNYPIDGMPRTPFAGYEKQNLVKLFLFDVGLLNYMLSTGYIELKQQSYEYKGYIAENFVQQEFAVFNREPTNSWTRATAEIEFILNNDAGEVIPVEMKSGRRTKAKSLQAYIDRYSPNKTIKLTGTQGSNVLETTNIVLPLYYTEYLPEMI